MVHRCDIQRSCTFKIMPIVWVLWLSYRVHEVPWRKRKQEKIKNQMTWGQRESCYIHNPLSEILKSNSSDTFVCLLFIYLFATHLAAKFDQIWQLTWQDVLIWFVPRLLIVCLYPTLCENLWFCYRNINVFDWRVSLYPIGIWHTYTYVLRNLKIMNSEYIWPEELWKSDYEQ